MISTETFYNWLTKKGYKRSKEYQLDYEIAIAQEEERLREREYEKTTLDNFRMK